MNKLSSVVRDKVEAYVVSAMQEERKIELLDNLSIAVEKLQNDADKNVVQVVYGGDAFSNLCDSISDILHHGLKDKLAATLKGKASFWPVIEKICLKEDIQIIYRLPIAQSDTNRCHAWVRMSLKEHTIGSYLSMLLDDTKTLRDCYHYFAFMRDTVKVESVKTLFQYVLSTLEFNINIEQFDDESKGSRDSLESPIGITLVQAAQQNSTDGSRRKSGRRKTKTSSSKIAQIKDGHDTPDYSSGRSSASSQASLNVERSRIDLSQRQTTSPGSEALKKTIDVLVSEQESSHSGSETSLSKTSTPKMECNQDRLSFVGDRQVSASASVEVGDREGVSAVEEPKRIPVEGNTAAAAAAIPSQLTRSPGSAFMPYKVPVKGEISSKAAAVPDYQDKSNALSIEEELHQSSKKDKFQHVASSTGDRSSSRATSTLVNDIYRGQEETLPAATIDASDTGMSSEFGSSHPPALADDTHLRNIETNVEVSLDNSLTKTVLNDLSNFESSASNVVRRRSTESWQGRLKFDDNDMLPKATSCGDLGKSLTPDTLETGSCNGQGTVEDLLGAKNTEPKQSIALLAQVSASEPACSHSPRTDTSGNNVLSLDAVCDGKGADDKTNPSVLKNDSQLFNLVSETAASPMLFKAEPSEPMCNPSPFVYNAFPDYELFEESSKRGNPSEVTAPELLCDNFSMSGCTPTRPKLSGKSAYVSSGISPVDGFSDNGTDRERHSDSVVTQDSTSSVSDPNLRASCSFSMHTTMQTHTPIPRSLARSLTRGSPSSSVENRTKKFASFTDRSLENHLFGTLRKHSSADSQRSSVDTNQGLYYDYGHYMTDSDSDSISTVSTEGPEKHERERVRSMLADLGISDEILGLKEDHFATPESFMGFSSREELEHAIDSCKKLIKNLDEESADKNELVNRLVLLRIKLQEEKDTGLIRSVNSKRILGHKFTKITNDSNNYFCDCCGSTIWGIFQSQVKCDDCAFRSHKKCLKSVDKPCVSQKISESEYITVLCPEVGLASQQYRCADCRRRLICRDNRFDCRLCDYTGHFYCHNCHWNETMEIPARIIHNWDFVPRKVSRQTKHLLTVVAKKPIICIRKLNPALFNFVEELRDVRVLREQILIMKSYLTSCRVASEKRMLLLLKYRQHFVDGTDMYSLTDLIDVRSGWLIEELAKIHSIFARHIKFDCILCQAKAFFCEICRVEEAIYPFEHTAVRCGGCKATFHRNCFSKDNCPRCHRLARRKESGNK